MAQGVSLMPLKRQTTAHGKCQATTKAGRQWPLQPSAGAPPVRSTRTSTEPPNSVAKVALATARCMRANRRTSLSLNRPVMESGCWPKLWQKFVRVGWIPSSAAHSAISAWRCSGPLKWQSWNRG